MSLINSEPFDEEGDVSLKRLVRRVGKVVKKVAPVVAPFIPGVGGVLASVLASRSSSAPQTVLTSQGVSEFQPPRSSLLLPLPQQQTTFGGGGIPTGVYPILGPVRNLRQEMSGMSLLSQATGQSGQVVPISGNTTRIQGRDGRFRTYRWSARKGRYVQVRRTNPTNVHALRRALRRAEGFIKIEKRVDRILRKMAPRARVASKVGFVRRKR